MAKRIKWSYGDIFGLPLNDGSFGIVQLIDNMMTNVVYIAVFKVKIASINEPFDLKKDDIISLVATWKNSIGNGNFHKIRNETLHAKKEEFRNEQFKGNGYIGAKHYDEEIIVDFLNAYHKLAPWDDWFDTNYLDEFLISPNVKPENLIYTKK